MYGKLEMRKSKATPRKGGSPGRYLTVDGRITRHLKTRNRSMNNRIERYYAGTALGKTSDGISVEATRSLHFMNVGSMTNQSGFIGEGWMRMSLSYMFLAASHVELYAFSGRCCAANRLEI